MARIGKPKKAQKKKFQIKFDNNRFEIVGRSPFGSRATKIAVNQNKAKGHVEDRRHILHYDEVLKPAIERVVGKLFIDHGRSVSAVARIVRRRMEASGIKRLPKNDNKLIERFVTEINSAPDNLVPDRADTNKAIEVVRGYVRKYIKQLSTEAFSDDCRGDNRSRMDAYKKMAGNIFIQDSSGGDITAERNRIHGEIAKMVDGCEAPAQLWCLLHEIMHSVTFDFSPKIVRDNTVKALEWQREMLLVEDGPGEQQLDVLMKII
ncbi:hypothetical protein [Luteimonas deserti]|uniref:Uncharacterized protein n=1 Tax=Luteimonas deserti TaxID=2752306 RepID=A0A7Z0QUJ2_9GAMM|nr:hypothetical protein [Luteimonas deserti]NYZ64289.1 hypothetical protein [Luteimonas deserti]